MAELWVASAACWYIGTGMFILGAFFVLLFLSLTVGEGKIGKGKK